MPHAELHIEELESKNPEVKVLKVKGRVDSTVSEEFGKSLEALFNQGFTKFVLLLHAEYMSTAALREMIAFVKQVRTVEGDVKVAELSERIAAIMVISSLDLEFDIFESKQKAEESYTTAK